MRTTSDAWWKKYSDLPRDAEEDRLAQDVSAKRDTLHQSMDAFATVVTGNDQSKVVAGAKDLQAKYNDLALADDALRKLQFTQAQQGFDDCAGCLRDVPPGQHRRSGVGPAGGVFLLSDA